MKRVLSVIVLSLIGTANVFADTLCSRDGSLVRFSSDDGALLELKMCSQSVVRVRFAPDGVLEDERKYREPGTTEQ